VNGSVGLDADRADEPDPLAFAPRCEVAREEEPLLVDRRLLQVACVAVGQVALHRVLDGDGLAGDAAERFPFAHGRLRAFPRRDVERLADHLPVKATLDHDRALTRAIATPLHTMKAPREMPAEDRQHSQTVAHVSHTAGSAGL